MGLYLEGLLLLACQRYYQKYNKCYTIRKTSLYCQYQLSFFFPSVNYSSSFMESVFPNQDSLFLQLNVFHMPFSMEAFSWTCRNQNFSQLDLSRHRFLPKMHIEWIKLHVLIWTHSWILLQMEHSEGTVMQIGALSQGISHLTVCTNSIRLLK